MPRLAFALSIAVSLALLACADDGEPVICDGEPCPPTCNELGAEGPCDISDDDCQERIFRTVGCVLGVEERTRPPVRIISEEQHKAEVAAVNEMAAANQTALFDAGVQADASDDGAVARPAPPPDITKHAYGLFGLWRERSSPPPDTDQLGSYSGPRAGVTVINYGEADDSETSVRTLAHEFVHAYQEQQYGLGGGGITFGGATFGSTRDSTEARLSLVEGEARLYELLAWERLMHRRVDPSYLHAIAAEDIDRARKIIAAGRSPSSDVGFLRYGVGASYMLRVWLDGGNRAVQAIHDATPATSVQWLRGIASRNREPSRSSDRSFACLQITPPEGTTAFDTDSLGAYYLFGFLTVTQTSDGQPAVEQSWQRALEWQRDSFQIFVAPNYEIAASWRLRFTSEQLARDLERELAHDAPQLLVHRTDAELELRAADSAELLESWTSFDCDD